MAEFYPFWYMCSPPFQTHIHTYPKHSHIQQGPSKWLLNSSRVRSTLKVHYLWSSPVMAASSELFPQPTFPTMPTSAPCREGTHQILPDCRGRAHGVGAIVSLMMLLTDKPPTDISLASVKSSGKMPLYPSDHGGPSDCLHLPQRRCMP